MNKGRTPIATIFVLEVRKMTLTCVGIDVFKGKSTVSAHQWSDIVVMKPHDVLHTASALGELADSIKCFSGEVRVVMEHTGRY